MILVGGFVTLPNDIPKPLWKYPLQEIAFHKYAYYQGMFNNEFEGAVLPSFIIFSNSQQLFKSPNSNILKFSDDIFFNKFSKALL